ncbi:MAG TPA: DUF3592 domain-containing protein [Anaerolineaceae bacterium]|nr:DUF3592 domain-containing protein [Anaerolineaceae bacterium]
MGDYVIWIVAVIPILVGLVMLLNSLSNSRKAKAAESWPIAPGTIVRSGVKEYTTRSNGITTHSYEPVVFYQYNLMGKLYEGKQLAIGSTRVKESEAQAITDKYLAGTPVNVHYNPNKPEESVLEVVSRSSKAFLILGLIFIGLGLILAVTQLF